MPNVSDSEVEFQFGREPLRGVFPSFCNSLISLEAPRTKSFPVLTTKAGADGGIDGEWDLTGVDGFQPVSVASAGWNVYQFKSLDIATLGAQGAYIGLCQRIRGAVADVISRQAVPKVLGKYVLFTNLRLGVETESTTADGRSLNTWRHRLHDELLKGASEGIEIEIIDAGQIAGFIARHPALRMGWFCSGEGRSWDEMQQRECTLRRAGVPLIGRDAEVADLQGWLASPDVRVIAVSGPNSVGKTRLVIEATQPYAPTTFFAEDVHALLRDGVAAYATADRSVVIVVEDPPSEVARLLADQAAGCRKPIKLIITLPSPERAPVVRLGDDSLVKVRQIPRLLQDAARRLVDAVDSSLDHRVRDWILHQAGGIPGVLIAAASMGTELHRDSESLREQISRKFQQSLAVKAEPGALTILQALCPLIYVRVGADSNELDVLISEIAPDVHSATVLRRLSEFESLGFLRRQGQYVAVVPPMFAAALFRGIIQSNPQLIGRLLAGLDLPGLKRLLERLVTLELPESTPFVSFVFGPTGPFGDTERFCKNIQLLDYLARAIPEATARFLRKELDLVWRAIIPRANYGATHFLAAINELLDESATTATAFAILTELAKREAIESDSPAAGNDFAECFVYWYPRSISYPEREAALEEMLIDPEPAVRRLALKAIIMGTNPPDSLGGRSVNARRIGSQPRYGTWRDCWDFLLRITRLRLTLCVGGDLDLQAPAREKLPMIISQLGSHLPVEDTMQLVREISRPYFLGDIPLDPIELHASVKWLRDFYHRSSKSAGQSTKRAEWQKTIDELDVLLARLVKGTFDHRLRFAIGRSSDYDEVIVDGRKLHEYQARILELAREICRDPRALNEATWDLLRIKESVHRGDFAFHLGESDHDHQFWPQLLARGADWPWPNLIGFYLAGANTTMAPWVQTTLDEMLISPTAPKNAVLVAICAIGPTSENRLRLRQMLLDRAVSVDEVARSFSSGRWLKGLPPEEVRDVLEFILSEPGREASMLDVACLYLHHEIPLPRELFDIAKRVLREPVRRNNTASYELDQVASALARTDLDEGFKLLEEVMQSLAKTSPGFWRIGWDPFEDYSTQDFWKYLRTQSPSRAYKLLGEWKRASNWPHLRGRGDKHLLDLSAHYEVLTEIARTSRDASRTFAECLHLKQPRFFDFAYTLVELHPNDSRVAGELNAAFISQSGSGYEFDRLTSTLQTVQSELQGAKLSAVARSWLESLRDQILARRSDAVRDSGASEPIFFD
jgi:hypothetical protein